jgi:hypothetical protein
MKNKLLVIAFSAFMMAPIASFAQYEPPLAELEKLCMKNGNDFETFALTNDYTLQPKLSTAEKKIYSSDKAGASGKKYLISRFQVPKAMTEIIFVTTDKKYYIELKGALASAKYKFVKQDDKKIEGVDATGNDFSNGKYSISLYTYTKGDVNYYEVQIHA